MNARELVVEFARRRERWRDAASPAESDLLRALESRGDPTAREHHARLQARLERRSELAGPPPRKQRRSKTVVLKITDAIRVVLAFDPTPTPPQRVVGGALSTKLSGPHAIPEPDRSEPVPLPDTPTREPEPTAYQWWLQAGARRSTPFSGKEWLSAQSRTESSKTINWESWPP